MKKIVLFLLLAVVLVACGNKNSSTSGTSGNGDNGVNPVDPYAGLVESSYEATGIDLQTRETLYQTVYLYKNPNKNNRIEKARIEFKDSKMKVVADVKYNGDDVAGLEGTYTDVNGRSVPVEFPARDAQGLLEKAERQEFLAMQITIQ